MNRLLPFTFLLACTACTAPTYLACPGADLHRCAGMSHENADPATHDAWHDDADGVKDKDHGLPDGHGGVWGNGHDPDEKGDNGGGSTEH